MSIDKFTLKLRQAMPLKDKIRFTERRKVNINDWTDIFTLTLTELKDLILCGDCDCRYGQILNKINEVLN